MSVADVIAHQEAAAKVSSRSSATAGKKEFGTQLWPYMVLFAVLAVLISVIFWRSKSSKEQRLNEYFTIISALGVLFVLITLVFADVRSSRHAVDDEIAQVIQQSQVNGLGVEKEFMNDGDLLRLYQELYPNFSELQKLPTPFVTSQVRRKEINMIQQLLMIVQNVNLIVSRQSQGWNNPVTHTWLVTFSSWLHAPLVYQQWQQSQHLWTNATNAFIGALRRPVNPAPEVRK